MLNNKDFNKKKKLEEEKRNEEFMENSYFLSRNWRKLKNNE